MKKKISSYKAYQSLAKDLASTSFSQSRAEILKPKKVKRIALKMLTLLKGCTLEEAHEAHHELYHLIESAAELKLTPQRFKKIQRKTLGK